MNEEVLRAKLNLLEELFVLSWITPNIVMQNIWCDIIYNHNGILGIPRRDGKTTSSNFKDAANSMLSQNQRFLGEQTKQSKRTLVKETFEALVNYCKVTKQFEKFQASIFYPLLRILRNASSHADMGTLQWPPDFIRKGLVSVQHKSIVYTIADVGKELDILVQVN